VITDISEEPAASIFKAEDAGSRFFRPLVAIYETTGYHSPHKKNTLNYNITYMLAIMPREKMLITKFSIGTFNVAV
jgi:hypothetical protein